MNHYQTVFIIDRLFHRFLLKSRFLSETNVYGVVLAPDSDNPGLKIEIRLKTDKPAVFKIFGFSPDMMVKLRFLPEIKYPQQVRAKSDHRSYRGGPP